MANSSTLALPGLEQYQSYLTQFDGPVWLYGQARHACDAAHRTNGATHP